MSSTVSRSVRALLIAASLIATASCGSGGTEPHVDAVGSFAMTTRNGAPLPTVISTGDSLLGGQLVIRSDSTYTLNPRYRTGGGAPFTTTIQGPFSVSGSAISYLGSNPPAVIATGTVSADGVTFVQGGVTYGFARQ